MPAVGAVQRWFVARRGFASGVAVAGIGVGTLAMPPLAAWLIALEGWRSGYLWLGLLSIVVGGGAALLIEHSPERRGLAPDGAITQRAPAETQTGMTLGAALRSAPFWLIFTAAGTTSFGMFIPFVHVAAYAVDHVIANTAGGVVRLHGCGNTE